MNVFNKVTLASLKKNRTRTVVTIIGIMLSAAMICASTTFVASMQNFVLSYTIYKTGDWHGAVYALELPKANAVGRVQLYLPRIRL